MLCDMAFFLSGLQKPLFGRLRIRDCLLSSERLGGDDKECCLWITSPQSLRDVRAVDIRHEVRCEVAFRVVLESLSDHDGTKVRATNADVHNRLDLLARVPLPLATSDALGEDTYMLEHTSDLVNARLRDLECVAKVAQRNVQHSTILRSIDMLAGKHGIARILDARLSHEVEKLSEDFLVDQILGEVEKESGVRRLVLSAELLEAIRISCEEVLDDQSRLLRVVEGPKLLPCLVVWMTSVRHGGQSKHRSSTADRALLARVPGILKVSYYVVRVTELGVWWGARTDGSGCKAITPEVAGSQRSSAGNHLQIMGNVNQDTVLTTGQLNLYISVRRTVAILLMNT